MAAASGAISELRHFCCAYYEQIVSSDVVAIAQGCARLERVQLNADDMSFQIAPIDEAVLALGRHCPELMHLDLYGRRMDNAAGVLAEACRRWPKLHYLCAANTGRVWDEDPTLHVLPLALASHCLLLRELVLYDVPTSWQEILQPCSFFLRLDPGGGED